MNNSYRLSPFVLLLSSTLLISACSTTTLMPGSRIDYKSAESTNPLEFPPDLMAQQKSAPNANKPKLSLNQYQQQKTTNRLNDKSVLPQNNEITLKSEGNQRWLVTNLPADRVWTQTMQLLQDNGLRIESSDATAGLIETAWAENRADIPDGFIRAALTKYLDNVYSAPTRDKFKIRIERQQNQLHIYITHYGMKTRSTGKDDQFHTWIERPRDPELEAELLARLQARLGGHATQLQQDNANGLSQPSLMVIMAGNQHLQINRSRDNLWAQISSVVDDGETFRIVGQTTDRYEYKALWVHNASRTGLARAAFWRRNQMVETPFTIQLQTMDDGHTQLNLSGELSDDLLNLLTQRLQNNLY